MADAGRDERSERNGLRSQLRAMRAVSRVLAAGEAPEMAIPKVLDALAGSLGFALAGYWTPVDDHLELRSAWTAPDVDIAWAAMSEAHRFAPGDGLAGRAWKTRAPVHVADVVAENLPRHEAFVAARVRSGLAFPVIHDDQVIGIVDLFARVDIPVDDDLVETLHAIGGQLGHELRIAAAQVALHNEMDAVRSSFEQISRANAELDQFAYVTSHDLRAPLRGITNLAAWIEEDLGSSTPRKVREHISLLKSRAARMDRLINGLLELARVGRVRQRPERVEVTELLHETIDLLSPPESARVLIIGAMPTVVAERVALQQVFLNLIGNAIQHAGRKDVMVKITAQDKNDEVELAIADNGVGIPREHHERVWQIFQTLASRDVTETTGIGLTIVKKQVEANGGRAWIDPDTTVGATLRFTWPRRAASVLQPRSS